MRLSSDPDVIIENAHVSGQDDVTEDSQQADDIWNSVGTRMPANSASDGRTESGWIFRNGEENVLFSLQKRSWCQKSPDAVDNLKVSQQRKTEEPVSATGNQDSGLPCCLSMRSSMFSLHSLLHPSELRRKAGTGVKRNHDLDKEHPVEQHIQQLKKKKVAYFCKEADGATKNSPQTQTAASANQEADMKTHVTPPAPASPRAAPTAKRGTVSEVAAVPPTAVPVARDDDDHWFRTHWTSQLPKSQRPFEE